MTILPVTQKVTPALLVWEKKFNVKTRTIPKNFIEKKKLNLLKYSYASLKNRCSTQITLMYVRQPNVEGTKLASVAAGISDNGGSKYNG